MIVAAQNNYSQIIGHLAIGGGGNQGGDPKQQQNSIPEPKSEKSADASLLAIA